jgi:tRNA pseudouridine55 synthase
VAVQSAPSPFGFINAFKPPGPSSAAFGNWIKHLFAGAAVGHWGTLDPTACGVLLLAVGKATKLLPLLPHARKQYVFELVVGERTETGDASGRVIETAAVPDDWRRALAAAAAALIGPQDQVPPMHSAVKVEGRPLYRSARAGVEVARPARATIIHQLSVIDDAIDPSPQPKSSTRAARLFVECEAGTYVRVLCEELGRRFGLPARMGALLRTASGPFLLRDSVRPDQIAADPGGCLMNPLDVLRNPRVELDERGVRRFAHGNEIRLGGSSASESGDPRAEVLVTRGAELLGCGHIIARDGDELLTPTRVFTAP